MIPKRYYRASTATWGSVKRIMKAKEIAQNADWTKALCQPYGMENDKWDTEVSLRLEETIKEYGKQIAKEQREICAEIGRERRRSGWINQAVLNAPQPQL